MQYVAVEAKIWWNNKGLSFFLKHGVYASDIRSTTWLLLSQRYSKRRKFLLILSARLHSQHLIVAGWSYNYELWWVIETVWNRPSEDFTQSLSLIIYTVSQKNVPPLACYNFDTRERILIFFGRNVTDKVSNKKTLYCATPNNLYFCTTWQNGETQKSHFFTQMLCQCIAKIQLLTPWFLQSFWLMTHTHAAVWHPKSCSQYAQLRAVGGAWFRRKEVESAAALGLCCTHNACAPMRCLPKREQENQHPLTGQHATNFRLLANQWAQRRLVTQWRHGCRAMRRSVCNAGASNGGRFAFRCQGNRATPCQYIDTTRKAFDCATICRWQFLYSETLHQTFWSLIVEVVQKTTNLGNLSPFWGS